MDPSGECFRPVISDDAHSAVLDDQYISALRGVASAARRLRPLLNEVSERCDALVRMMQAGTCAAAHDEAVIEADNRLRERTHGALLELEHAMREVRGLRIRIMVDSGERTLSEVARLLGISRQMASRLYRSTQPSPERSKDDWS